MSLLETTKEDTRYQDAHLMVDAERASGRHNWPIVMPALK